MKETSPLFFKERMQNEHEEQKRRSAQMENEMIANLASGETAGMLSGMNAGFAMGRNYPAANQDSSDRGFEQSLGSSGGGSSPVAGGALGKLGVKGLSLRLAEMLRKDPEGTYQYLEALGLQADAEALRAILPSLGNADENYRRTAVAALRFF
jgi:hypothetical protein